MSGCLLIFANFGYSKMILFTIISCLTTAHAKEEIALMTEVFEIVLNPPMFNWTYEGRPDQFMYQASALNAPDLPRWISYVFSPQHHCGYLFGVPPSLSNAIVELEVIAMNRKNYETRHEHINIHVTEKLNPAKYEVHLKIDNLNVDHMFEVERMDNLKDIFRQTLWKDSVSDLYLTFLASALDLGARRPLNPLEGEGVVLRLGSQAPFSPELTELQEEVRPLSRTFPCPRDFKRTKVERLFRNSGFQMDWCSFRLIDDSSSTSHEEETKAQLVDWIEHDEDDVDDMISRSEVPERSYLNEFLFTILVPMSILIFLVLVLSIILCFHHEGISKRMEETPATEINQFATIHRATQSLRSLSNNREITLSPEPIVLSSSPTTINRGVHCRPDPPPYVRPQFRSDL